MRDYIDLVLPGLGHVTLRCTRRYGEGPTGCLQEYTLLTPVGIPVPMTDAILAQIHDLQQALALGVCTYQPYTGETVAASVRLLGGDPDRLVRPVSVEHSDSLFAEEVAAVPLAFAWANRHKASVMGHHIAFGSTLASPKTGKPVCRITSDGDVLFEDAGLKEQLAWVLACCYEGASKHRPLPAAITPEFAEDLADRIRRVAEEEGAVNEEAFWTFMEKVLKPALLPTHKGGFARTSDCCHGVGPSLWRAVHRERGYRTEEVMIPSYGY